MAQQANEFQECQCGAGSVRLAIVGRALAYTPLRGGPKARNSLSFWRACAELQLRLTQRYCSATQAPRPLKPSPHWSLNGAGNRSQ